mgnify:FL=1
MKNRTRLKWLLVLFLPLTSLRPASAQDSADRQDTATWQVTPAAYPNDMLLTAVLEIEGVESVDTNDIVAAFWGDTDAIRGVAQPVFVPGIDRYLLSMFIYAEEEPPADSLTFQVFDASLDKVLPVKTKVAFMPDGLIGSFGDPFRLASVNLQLTVSTGPVLCLADTLGWAKVDFSGGDPPYSIAWSTGAETDSIYHLEAGPYTITVTEGNGFSREAQAVVENLEQEIPAPVISAAPTDTLCEGQSFFLFASANGAPTADIYWYDLTGDVVEIGGFMGVPELGSTTVFSAEANLRNCLSEQTEQVIFSHPAPSASFSLNDNDLAIQDTLVLVPEEMVDGYDYRWIMGDGVIGEEAPFRHVYQQAGLYEVILEVTTDAGCKATSSALVEVDELSFDLLVEVTAPLCQTDTTGAITAQAVNGMPPYIYSWNTGADSRRIEHLAPGEYTVTVTDQTGTAFSDTILLEPEQWLAAPAVLGSGTYCSGATVSLTTQESLLDGLTWWYADSTAHEPFYVGNNLMLSGVADTATFWAEARLNHCASAARTPVQVAVDAPDADFTVSAVVNAPEDTLFFASAVVDTTSTYEWDFGDGTTAQGSSAAHAYATAGVYEVELRVVTGQGCTATQVQFINIVESSFRIVTEVSAADCSDSPTGRASLILEGGQPPYQYQWSNGTSGPEAAGLLPGAYAVSVTESLPFETHPLGQWAPPGDAIIADFDNNGIMDIWAGEDSLRQAQQQSFQAFHWETPSVPLSNITHLSTLPAHQADTLLFVADSTGLRLSALRYSADTFAVEGIDAADNKVQAIIAADVDGDEDTDVFALWSGQVRWYRQSAGNWYEQTIDAPGGNSGQLALADAGADDWPDLVAGGPWGLSAYLQADPGSFSTSSLADTPVQGLWASGSTVLALHSNGEVVRYALETGTSEVLFTAPSTAVGVWGLDMAGNGRLDILLDLGADGVLWYESMPEGYLQRGAPGPDAGGGVLALADLNGDQLPDLLTGALQWEENRSGQGSTASTEFIVGAATDTLPLPVIAGGGDYCTGSNVQLSAVAPDSEAKLNWYRDSTAAIPFHIGDALTLYGVTGPQSIWVEASYGDCTSPGRTNTRVRVESPTPGFHLSAAGAFPGEMLTATPDTLQAGYAYQWDWGGLAIADQPESSFQFDQPGVYEVTLTVTSPLGCQASAAQSVVIWGGTVSLEADVVPASCSANTGAVHLQVAGGMPPYTLAWSNGGTGLYADSLEAGQYTVTATDAVGATAQLIMEVPEAPSALLPPMVSGADMYCQGTQVTLSAFAEATAADIWWYDSSDGITPLFAGHQLTLSGLDTDTELWAEARLNECISERVPVLVEVAELNPSITVSNHYAQPGESLTFLAPAGLDYEWAFGDGQSASGPGPHTHAYEIPGNYEAELLATNALGCTAATTVNLQVWAGDLALDLQTQPATCQGTADGQAQVQVVGGTPPYSIQWSEGSVGPFLNDVSAGVYAVTVTDDNGYSRSAQVSIDAGTSPAAPDVIINAGNFICAGEDAWAAAYQSGASGEADYYWYPSVLSNEPIQVGEMLFLWEAEESHTYYVEARTAGGCVSGRTAVPIQVARPNAAFTTDFEVVYVNQAITFEAANPQLGQTFVYDWGDNTPNGTLSILQHTYSEAGIYEVTLTALAVQSGCTDVQTKRIQVLGAPDTGGGGGSTILQAFPFSEAAACPNSPSGALSAAAVGGMPPYTYAWSNGSTEAYQEGVLPGPYTLTVTDNQGAQAYGGTFVGADEALEPPQLTVLGPQPACPGTPLAISAAGIRPGAAVYWYDSATGGTLLGQGPVLEAMAGGVPDTIYAEARLGACTSARTPVDVDFEVPSAAFTASPAAPSAGQAVSFQATQPASATFSWAFGDGILAQGAYVQHTYVEAGTYQVTLRAVSGGCEMEEQAFIVVSGATAGGLSVDLELDRPLCAEDATGGLSAVAVGGTPPFSYAWSTGDTGGAVGGLLPGYYAVTVTDSEGKTGQAAAELLPKVPELPAPAIGQAAASVCAGEAAWLSATGGPAGAQYQWSQGGSPVYTGSYLWLPAISAPQSYEVRTVYEGCHSAESAAATVGIDAANAGFTLSAVMLTVGEVLAAEADGPSGDQYTWDFGDGETAAGPSAGHIYTAPGQYRVELIAQTPGGCTATQSQWVEVLSGQGLSLQLALAAEAPSCPGVPDGSLTAAAEGGLPPYAFSWSNGASGSSTDELVPGLYEVTVTDAEGQEVMASYQLESAVGDLPPPVVSVPAQACMGNPVTMVAVPPTPGATVLWYPASTGGAPAYAGAVYTLPATASGWYAGTALGGCVSEERAAAILNPRAVSAAFSIDPGIIQPGTSVSFVPDTVGTGWAYEWSFGDGNYSAEESPLHNYASSGTFLATLTVTDSAGCTATTSRSLAVGDGQALAVAFESVSPFCAEDEDGEVQALVTGGLAPYSYIWDHGATSDRISGLSPGVYRLTVADATGNTVSGEVALESEVPALPAPVALAGQDTLCAGDLALMYAYDPGGVAGSFLWYGSANGNGLLGSGAAYSQQGLNSTAQTFYVESVRDGCRSPERSAVTLYQQNLSAGFQVSSPAVAAGETVEFQPDWLEAGYSYQWSFGDGQVAQQAAPTHAYQAPGAYSVGLTVTSPQGCTASAVQPNAINVAPAGQLSLALELQRPECETDSTGMITITDVVNGTAPYTVNWSEGSTGMSVEELAAGSYTLTLTDADGHSLQRQLQLNALYNTPPAPTVAVPGGTPLCASESALLTATTGQIVDQFWWYDEDSTLIGTGNNIALVANEAGPLSVHVQASRGSCFSASSALTLNVQAPQANFGISGNLIAQEEVAFEPVVSSYASYSWDFGDGQVAGQVAPIHTYALPGAYPVTLEVTTAEGCTAQYTQSLNIAAPQQMTVALSTTPTLCAASSAGAIHATPQGGTPPFAYQWSNGATTASIEGLPPGDYSLTVTDANGLSASHTGTVISLDTPPPAPELSANGGAVVCRGEPAYLSATVPGYPQAAISWYESLSADTPFATGPVWVSSGFETDKAIYTRSEVDGCASAMAQHFIEVQAPVTAFTVSPAGDIEEGELVQFLPAEPCDDCAYYWAFGDNGWSTATAPYYFYNLPGTFDVSLEVTDTAGCSAYAMEPALISVSAWDGFQEELEERGASLQGSAQIDGHVFPNPFRTFITAALSVEQPGRYQLELLDTYGKQLLSRELSLGGQVENLRLNLRGTALPPGMYYLRLRGQSGGAMVKLIKQ